MPCPLIVSSWPHFPFSFYFHFSHFHFLVFTFTFLFPLSLFEVVHCLLIVSSWRHFPLSFLRRQWEGCRYLVTEPEISNLLGGSPKPSTHTHHRKFFCKHFIDCKPPQAPHPHEAGQNFSLRTFYQWQATPQLVGHKPSTQTPIHKSSPPCKTTSLQTLYSG